MMTLSIMTLSKMTLSIKGLYVTLNNGATQHNNALSLWNVIMQSVAFYLLLVILLLIIIRHSFRKIPNCIK
jgi:hypothetical protein